MRGKLLSGETGAFKSHSQVTAERAHRRQRKAYRGGKTGQHGYLGTNVASPTETDVETHGIFPEERGVI